MISKLQDKIPLDYGKLVDEHGNVKYFSILTNLKSFMEDVKNSADESLKAECGRVKFRIFFKRQVIAAAVMNEALECAIGVDQSPGQNKENNGKFPEQCNSLDGMFKAGLQKIWVLIEPSDVYINCETLPNSDTFKKMIRKLRKNKIPIDSKKAAKWFPEDTVNYKTNVLTAMKMYMDKNTDPNTYVLKDGLKCAIDVYQFQQQILEVKKVGDKVLPYAKKWSDLDKKFWAAFKQIWEPKKVKLDNEAAEHINAGVIAED
jgi:hypothetical protein